MEEWKEYKYTELCSLIGGGTPKTSESSYWGGEIPWLSVKDFGTDRKYVYTTEKTITKEGLENSSTKLLQKDDIIISARGTIGAMAMIVYPMAFNQSCFGIRGNELVNKDFLYYLTKTKLAELQKNSHGSVFETITRDTFAKLKCIIPPLKKQMEISAILKSFDDKIEVNRRINDNFVIVTFFEILLIWMLINDNLEQQMQATFDELIMNEELPRTKFLKDYAFVNPSRIIKKGEVKRYIDMSSLPTKGSFPSDWIDRPYNGGMKFQNGDTIMARITPCLENGKTAYINFLEKDEIAFGSTEYIVMAPHNGMPSEMFYFLARNEDFVSYAVAHMNGSSGRQRVSATDIENYIMPDIPIHSIKIFGKKTCAVMECIKNNSLENRKLSSLRDTLLPRLMSGELNVCDINM